MGGDKAVLPFGPGLTMLGRVVELVGRAVVAERIVCVAGPGQILPELTPGVRVVRDARPHEGPLAGLVNGLAALGDRAEAAYVTGCDAPLLVPAFVERMFDLLGEDEIAAPQDGERWHPLAAVYRTDVLSTAEALLSSGKRSLIALLEHCRTRRVAGDELREVDSELATLTTCNTPEEYEAVICLAEQGPEEG